MRCHQDIPSDTLIAHVDKECPKREDKAEFSADCAKCGTFDMPENPYFTGRLVREVIGCEDYVECEGHGGIKMSHCADCTLKAVTRRINFLRQWLNEDCITDPKKMVTSEEIRHWLFATKL